MANIFAERFPITEFPIMLEEPAILILIIVLVLVCLILSAVEVVLVWSLAVDIKDRLDLKKNRRCAQRAAKAASQ